MASYLELYAASGGDTQTNLRKQIIVAISIKANVIAKLATPTAPQRAFAIAALKSPESY